MNESNLENYKIKEFWIDELISAAKEIFEPMSTYEILALHPFDADKKAIVISFDKNWEPFVGQSRGFNNPEDRIYFSSKQLPQLLLKIRSTLQRQGRQIPGGRIFIDRNSVFFIDKQKEKNRLFLIEYSKTRDIAKEFEQMLDTLRLYKIKNVFGLKG